MLVCPSGIFPEADKDPVIQIANMVIRQGDKDPFIRNVFTLKKCAPIIGAQVFSFDREADLLKVRPSRNIRSLLFISDGETCLGGAGKGLNTCICEIRIVV